MDSNQLTVMDEQTMLRRVEMARFPQDLTKPDKTLLAQVAITYGFDPLMGEVSIYQRRPYVSIDGRYRKAQETGQLDGVETRPATKQEKEDWQIPEGDYFYRSEVYLKGSTRPFVAWGRVHKAETVGGKGFKPVEKNPQRMAEKRAEAQALRKAFHIPLPSVEDIGSPDYDADSTAVEVDTDTGEINEPKPKAKENPQSKTAVADPEEPEVQEPVEMPTESTTEGIEKEESAIAFDWINETLQIIRWSEKTALSWLKAQLRVEGDNLTDVLNSLGETNLHRFIGHIKAMREASGKD